MDKIGGIESVEFLHYWSNEISEKAIMDVVDVVNNCFGPFYSVAFFHKKITENIFGPSLVTLAYINKKPIGVDILWRNDIDGELAYQTIDTCVLSEYRGRGIFSEITKKELAFIGEDVFVFGFPNENSTPGYRKMGWIVLNMYLRQCTPFFISRHSSIQKIDESFVNWWFVPGSNLYYWKSIRGDFYIVRRRKHWGSYYVLGSTNSEIKTVLPKASKVIFLSYSSYHKTILSKKTGVVVRTSTPNNIKVPFWIIDTK